MAARSVRPSPSKSARTGLQRVDAGCPTWTEPPGRDEERPDAVRTAADVTVDTDGVREPVAVDVPDRDVERTLVAAAVGAGSLLEDAAGPEGVGREDVVREALRAAHEELRPTVRVDVQGEEPRHGGGGRLEHVGSSEAAAPVAPVQQDVGPVGERREIELPVAVEVAGDGSGQGDRRLEGRHGTEAAGPVAPEKDDGGRRAGSLRAHGVEDPVSVEVTDGYASEGENAPEDERAAGIVGDADLSVRADENVHPAVAVEVPGAEGRRGGRSHCSGDPEGERAGLRRGAPPGEAEDRGKNRRAPDGPAASRCGHLDWKCPRAAAPNAETGSRPARALSPRESGRPSRASRRRGRRPSACPRRARRRTGRRRSSRSSRSRSRCRARD